MELRVLWWQVCCGWCLTVGVGLGVFWYGGCGLDGCWVVLLCLLRVLLVRLFLWLVSFGLIVLCMILDIGCLLWLLFYCWCILLRI